MTEISWTTDAELGLVAHHLGQKIMEMYNKAGIGTSSDFGFGPNHDTTFIGSVILDAEDFTTLDPAKIIGEFERMVDVRGALNDDSQAVADLEQVATSLSAHWSGEAADRFHDQMIFVREFLRQHAERVDRAILALGMVFAIGVEARRNFRALAESAIVACEQEMAEQEVRTAEAEIKMTATLVNGVLDMVSKNPTELIKNGLQGLVNVNAAMNEIDLKTSGAPQVVEAYTTGRDRLRTDFEEALNLLKERIDRDSDSLGDDSVPLNRPIPAAYDPSSPDFRYETFHIGDRPVAEFGPRIEQHREMERANDPESAVSRRLDAR